LDTLAVGAKELKGTSDVISLAGYYQHIRSVQQSSNVSISKSARDSA